MSVYSNLNGPSRDDAPVVAGSQVTPRHTTYDRTSSQLPVTALTFTSCVFSPSEERTILLAAEDTAVTIYDTSRSTCLAKIDLFAEQTIHGINVVGSQVLAWGNKQVAYFRLDGLRAAEEVHDGSGRCQLDIKPDVLTVEAPDWVYDGKLSPRDPGAAVLATAHNEVVRLSIDAEEGFMRVEEVVSPARPILYSAELMWLDGTSVLMAAGTAFGEILVWKCHFSHSPGRHDMLFVFTGHEGSIYGITISPMLTLPGSDETARLLASCSDDRTVRIWDITERDSQRKEYDFSSARETGFSEILPNADQPKLEGGEPVAVGMGHLSRIWGVEVGEGNEKGAVNVWTFGEDSTAWRWRLDLKKGEKQVRGSLAFQKALSYHDGKHLWSHATGKFEGKGFLATGGADGRISLIETDSDEGAVSDTVTLECQTLCPETAQKPIGKKAKPEVFGRFDFISQDQILVNTSAGRLLLGTYVKTGLEWKTLALEDSLQSELKQCYVLKGISPGTAILGTTTGNVYFYRNGGLSLVASFPRKVVDVNVLNFSENDCTASLLIHTFGTACPSFMVLNSVTGEVQTRMEVTGLDERFICTSAGLVDSYLVLGSRHGWLSILRRLEGSYEQVCTFLSPTRDGITAVVPLPVRPGDQQKLFLCTSRDSCYRIYALNSSETGDNPPSPLVTLVHHSLLPFGPMIESAFFTTHSPPQLIITGFRSKDFVVWNESLREERLSVECGGAHRSFAFHHGPTDEEVMRFTFNRASKLSVYSQLRLTASPLKLGTHGREIRAIASNGAGFIATAGEDTSIRILRDGPLERESCLASLKAHNSGIQKLQWLMDDTQGTGDLLFSSGGNEEFFAWRIRPLAGTTYPGLGVVQEAIFEDKSADGDLRIMDFDVQATNSTAVSSQSPGNEVAGGEAIITMVFSNSVLTRYRYDRAVGFTLLAKGLYTGSCLMQVRYLEPISGSGAEGAVLTASTDGHLAIWKNGAEKKTLEVNQVAKVHQSAVKCLDVQSLHSRSYASSPNRTTVVVTGGDDNALGVTILTPDLDFRPYGLARNAHAAAINGLLLRPMLRIQAAQSGREEGMQIVTVSNDQRFKVWELDTNVRRAAGLRLVQDSYSGVADPGAISDLSAQGEEIVIVGAGMETWRMKKGRTGTRSLGLDMAY